VSGYDEDCDGVTDNEPIDCDDGLAIDDSDAMAAARALDICRTADPNGVGADRTWGVLSARYVKADGTPGANALSHGLLADFGASEVQHGQRMLALSSGVARAPGQQDYQSPEGTNMGTNSSPPAGYPKESSSCPGVMSGDCNDSAALELDIRVPTNATSLAFNVGFYTHEFPQRTCTEYNDFFVTMIEPVPIGAADGNISLDGDGNPISVNSTSFEVCESQQAGGKTFPCTLGPGLLADTGFEGHAATGWLESTVPVERGSEITLRFAIWDSGDAIHDSTVLIDNFQWSVEAASDM
jgi:hypothetical protein